MPDRERLDALRFAPAVCCRLTAPSTSALRGIAPAISSSWLRKYEVCFVITRGGWAASRIRQLWTTAFQAGCTDYSRRHLSGLISPGKRLFPSGWRARPRLFAS
jgi:hypothetical protein